MKNKNLSYLLAGYFFVLFNYPLVRTSSITHFFEEYGAKSSPQAWVIAIIMLVISLGLSNNLQAKLGFKKTFILISFFSFFISVTSFFLTQSGFKQGAFLQFAWKEVYIVLQVHLLLAYANSWMDRETFLKWIGPIGAMGSVGGILGGLLTSWLATHVDLLALFFIGQVFVLFPSIFAFHLVPVINVEKTNHLSPFKSLDTIEVKKYVFLIASVIFLSQVVINISDFQFSVIFEKMISSSTERAIYLGHVFTATNALTLIFQLVLVPLMLRKLNLQWMHYAIPLSYLICLLMGLNVGVLLSSAVFYVFLKASDYSFFSSSKELLYHPMKPLQKYGAKYLTDMLVYRLSKALIAGVLIYLQDPSILFWIMLIALLLWVLFVNFIFKFHRKIFHQR